MEIGSLITNAYKGKKVFITGHTGFKGSWLSLWLQESGADLKGYALAPEKKSLYSSICKKLKIKSILADIRNYKRLEKEILSFKPDFIFHLAAQPLVRYSYKNPLETFEVNAMGTANLLNAVRKLRKHCSVVVVTTDKVYENKEQNYAYHEKDKLGGHDPYSSSKACAEIIVQSYRLSFFNPGNIDIHRKSIASARAGNVIGGGDYSADRIIPDIIRAIQKNKPVKIRNPNSIRPWQHVLDPLSGYLLLGAKMNSDPTGFSSAFNFGPDPNDVLTVEELAKVAVAGYGKGNYRVEMQKNNFHEAGLLTLDNSKAKSELGWRPVYDSRIAVAHTMDWYRKSFENGAGEFELCLEEIKLFTS